jgi:uncharacterized membrane protein
VLAFLDVLLRGVSLAAHSLIVGGALFVIAVLRPWSVASADSAANTATAVVVRRSRRLIIAAAAAVALIRADVSAIAHQEEAPGVPVASEVE